MIWWNSQIRIYTFQHDGGLEHRAKLITVITNWFQDNHIRALDWLGQLPDFNPIEHLWAHLKKKVVKQSPSSNSNLKKIVNNEAYNSTWRYQKVGGVNATKMSDCQLLVTLCYKVININFLFLLDFIQIIFFV